MRLLSAIAVMLALLCSLPAYSASITTTVWLPDNRAASLTGQLRGYDQHDYQLPLRQGQLLRLSLGGSSPGIRFRLSAPGNSATVLQGSADHRQHRVRITQDGVFTLQVSQTPDAARLGESSRFSLQLQATDPAGLTGHAQPPAFRRQLTWQQTRFLLECDCRSSLNTLQLRIDGPRQRQQWQLALDGNISDAALADLNADGYPELYLFLQSAGSGSHGSVLALMLDARQQWQQLPALQPLATEAEGQGYMGHDRFEIAGQRLLRRFPLYRPEDSNASPTGGWRELRYRLALGSNGWQLQLDMHNP